MGHRLSFGTIFLDGSHDVLSKLALFTNLEPHGSATHRLIRYFLRWDVITTVSLGAVECGAHAWPMHSTTYRSVRLSDSSGAERSELGSLSSSSSTWEESPHPTSKAGLRPPLDASVFGSDEFRCENSVDHFPLADGGSHEARSHTCTVALLAIAVLGSATVWGKVSVMARCGSPLTSQLKTSASQVLLQRTCSMPCAARRPRSCETQLHKNKTFGHSAASYRLCLVRSHCLGSPLAWSGRCWPPVPECCWSSCSVGAVAGGPLLPGSWSACQDLRGHTFVGSR